MYLRVRCLLATGTPVPLHDVLFCCLAQCDGEGGWAGQTGEGNSQVKAHFSDNFRNPLPMTGS